MAALKRRRRAPRDGRDLPGRMSRAGLFIRLRVVESPTFIQVKEHGSEPRVPLLEVLRHYPIAVTLAIGVVLVNTGGFYLVTTFAISYPTALGVPCFYQMATGIRTTRHPASHVKHVKWEGHLEPTFPPSIINQHSRVDGQGTSGTLKAAAGLGQEGCWRSITSSCRVRSEGHEAESPLLHYRLVSDNGRKRRSWKL
jgi:hypothetical protein